MNSEANPYRSPATLEPVSTRNEIRASRWRAQKRVRLAVVFGFLGAAHASVFYLVDKLARTSDPGDIQFYWIVFGGGAVLLLGMLLFGWLLLYPAMEMIATRARLIVAPNVTADKWLQATDDSFWPFPYAAGLGLLTWIAYWLVEFHMKGRAGPFNLFSDELVVGVIGHGLGAWCYLSILYAWFGMWRHSRAENQMS